MIQIKKTILTLALLLTAATGARAAWTGGTYTATANENLGAITVNGDATLTINSDVTVTVTGGINVASGTLTVTGPGTLVVNGAKGNDGNSDFDGGPGDTGGVAISGNIIVQGGATVTATGGNGGNGGNGDMKGGNGGNGGVAISGNIIVQGGATVTATGGTGGTGGNGDMNGGNGRNGGVAFAGTLTYKSGTVTANGGSGGSGGSGDFNGSSGSAGKAFANDVDFTQTTGYSVTDGTSTIGSVLNQTKVVISGGTDPSASSGPEVAWNKATKTGTFTMPGGNVTLEPEYYPQAALTAAPTAINDVPATTDGAIVKAGTVANIGTTETAQGTVMYYVSKDALDDAALLALAADQWTADVPTAKSLAQGQAYVYYYVRGNDSDTDEENFSDGDILAANALTVTIAAEPTYAVTFAEGTPESDKWKAEPAADVTKGTPVTVTYTGTKKVIGVKAEKKAKAPSLSLTNPVVGQVIGSDGKNYAAANVPSGVDKVAMIAYVSGSNGLAIALADESSLNWTTAKSTCEAKTPAFTGGTWNLPTQDEWKNMFKAFGGNNAKYTGLNNALAAAGGNGSELQTGDSYWSSSEIDENKAYLLYLLSSDGDTDWYDDSDKNIPYRVRACLAF